MPKAPIAAAATAVLALATASACLTAPVVAIEPTTKQQITDDRSIKPVDKVDLLFAIDNSGSMGDKQEIFKEAVPDLLRRLVVPNCIDPKTRRIVGPSQNGECAQGKIEFPPIKSLHVGVVSSSLGGAGSGYCGEGESNSLVPGVKWHQNDRGRLLNRAGIEQRAVPELAGGGFVAWYPNEEHRPPPGVTPVKDLDQLTRTFQDMVVGVREFGCGFEATMESWYRFLVQPDPYLDVTKEGDRAKYSGVDETILKQRKAFLRPDSLVVVVQITDENESYIDPLSYNGTGFRLLSDEQVSRPTGACATNAASDECKACLQIDEGKRPPECNPATWPKGDKHNSVQLRLFQTKKRFGYDPFYPVDRYVNGLGSNPKSGRPYTDVFRVPDRTGNGGYEGKGKCQNPLFAAELPSSANDELCDLKAGPRKPSQVIFATITGVPSKLLHFDPEDSAKSRLSDEDWTKILGRDPLHGDFAGADPHMIESDAPRPGLPGPGSADDADPVHGREYDTGLENLQYACTFALPKAKSCTNNHQCDCFDGSESPLCSKSQAKTQIRAKGYPGIRHLMVARGLRERGVVSSICPIDTSDPSPQNRLYGYRPAIKAITDSIIVGLNDRCLPRPLVPRKDGSVPCLLLQVLDQEGPIDTCHNEAKGWDVPDLELLAKFYEEQEKLGYTDIRKHPVCELKQLVVPEGQSCEAEPTSGWCYVAGQAALEASNNFCANAIMYSSKVPLEGRIHLRCIQESSAETGADKKKPAAP